MEKNINSDPAKLTCQRIESDFNYCDHIFSKELLALIPPEEKYNDVEGTIAITPSSLPPEFPFVKIYHLFKLCVYESDIEYLGPFWVKNGMKNKDIPWKIGSEVISVDYKGQCLSHLNQDAEEKNFSDGYPIEEKEILNNKTSLVILQPFFRQGEEKYFVVAQPAIFFQNRREINSLG